MSDQPEISAEDRAKEAMDKAVAEKDSKEVLACLQRCQDELTGILGLSKPLSSLVYLRDAMRDVAVVLKRYELKRL